MSHILLKYVSTLNDMETVLCALGTTLGFVMTFNTSGVLCEYGFDNGWGSIFYVTGLISPCVGVIKTKCDLNVLKLKAALLYKQCKYNLPI